MRKLIAAALFGIFMFFLAFAAGPVDDVQESGPGLGQGSGL